jgi:hypothetical protein
VGEGWGGGIRNERLSRMGSVEGAGDTAGSGVGYESGGYEGRQEHSNGDGERV